ncbi:methyltransferase [Pseudomonas typographi]|uniref:methyltransferase n=1 Tax=Pseudomonas typographi TaxID=2715964 RepID=UPI0016838AFE|nr:class I SAM-dependent methyltransferase [Pseudomonas typographi]MBD1587693.1 methyltransferase [Pseudomonas typographi]
MTAIETSTLPEGSVGRSSDTSLVELGRLLRQQGYRFTTVTPLTHQRVLARNRHGGARDLRDLFGWSLPFDAAVAGPQVLRQLQHAGALQPEGERWRSTVRWSSLDGLLLVHSSFPTQAQDAVFFGPDTYRFARAIKVHLAAAGAVRRAADIGCGSGAGALLIARAQPHAEVLALDINPRALHYAQANARLAGTVNVSCRHSDVLQHTEGAFDLIVANPPYMQDPERRAYRHGGDDLGSSLSRRIVEEAMQRLAPGGSLLLYTGVAMVAGQDPFLAGLRPLLEQPGWAWRYEEVDPDVFGEELETIAYASAERIAAVVLTLTREG